MFSIPADKGAAKKIVEIGQEEGRILEPTAFDLEPGGTFAIADAPNSRERVQLFSADGTRVGGFSLPGRSAPRVTIGNIVLNGVGSLQYTGRSLLMNQPESGALFMEYGLSGTPVRSIGTLRPTGQERDRDVHLALNTGLPLVHPAGGFIFVFQAGVPVFRRYDAQGRLLWERHIEGPELDGLLAALPTSWPRSPGGRGERADLPLVMPTVRTAAIDAGGNLWVVLSVPFTYVYDSVGDKRRTVQFSAPGLGAPASLFFTRIRPPARHARLLRVRRHINFPAGPRSRLRSSGRRSNCVADVTDGFFEAHERQAEFFGLVVGQRALLHPADRLTFHEPSQQLDERQHELHDRSAHLFRVGIPSGRPGGAIELLPQLVKIRRENVDTPGPAWCLATRSGSGSAASSLSAAGAHDALRLAAIASAGAANAYGGHGPLTTADAPGSRAIVPSTALR